MDCASLICCNIFKLTWYHDNTFNKRTFLKLRKRYSGYKVFCHLAFLWFYFYFSCFVRQRSTISLKLELDLIFWRQILTFWCQIYSIFDFIRSNFKNFNVNFFMDSRTLPKRPLWRKLLHWPIVCGRELTWVSNQIFFKFC